MKIIGIDPGTAETGYGIIEVKKREIRLVKHGSIKTSVNHQSAFRLNLIFKEVKDLLKDYSPDVLAIESIFFNSNAKSVLAVGQAMGVSKLAAAQKNIAVFEYPPLKIKMKLAGKGRAEKREIQSKVRKILRLRKIPRPTHAADALAVAICHFLEINAFKK